MGVAYVITNQSALRKSTQWTCVASFGQAYKPQLLLLSAFVLLARWREFREELWRYQNEHSSLQ
jgi:hypothetical protein